MAAGVPIPPLNLNLATSSATGPVGFGGITFNAPATTGAPPSHNLLWAAGLVAVVYFLTRR